MGTKSSLCPDNARTDGMHIKAKGPHYRVALGVLLKPPVGGNDEREGRKKERNKAN